MPSFTDLPGLKVTGSFVGANQGAETGLAAALRFEIKVSIITLVASSPRHIGETSALTGRCITDIYPSRVRTKRVTLTGCNDETVRIIGLAC